MKYIFFSWVFLYCLYSSAKASETECIAGATLHTLDWLQTRQITKRYDEGYFEYNPILNDRPTQVRVNQYFLLTGALLTYACEKGYGGNWLKYTWIAVESGAVGRNLKIGLQIKW